MKSDSQIAMEMGFERLAESMTDGEIDPSQPVSIEALRAADAKLMDTRITHPAREDFLEEFATGGFVARPGSVFINGERIGDSVGAIQFIKPDPIDFVGFAHSINTSFEIAGESFARFAKFMLDTFPSIGEYQDASWHRHKRWQNHRAAAMRQWTKRGRRR